MLTGTGFGNDSFFTQSLGQQNLPDRVIYLMCAGMTKIFTFKIKVGLVFSAKPFRKIQRCGTAYIIPQKIPKIFLKVVRDDFQIAYFNSSTLR